MKCKFNLWAAIAAFGVIGLVERIADRHYDVEEKKVEKGYYKNGCKKTKTKKNVVEAEIVD